MNSRNFLSHFFFHYSLHKRKIIGLGLSVILLFSLLAIQPLIAIIIVALIGLFAFLLLSPYTTLILIILTRSGIDNLARQYRLFSSSDASVNFLGLLNIAIVVLVVSYIVVIRRKIPNYPFVLIFLGFQIAIFMSIFVSKDILFSLRGWINTASFFAIYLLVVNIINNRKKLETFRVALALSVVVPLIYGGYQFLTYTGNTTILPGFNRIMGTFFHPSPYAMYLVIVWPIVLFQMVSTNQLLKKILYGILLVGMTLSTIFTYTRIAWIALVITIVGSLLIYKRFSLLFVFGISMLLLGLLYLEPIIDRISTAFDYSGGVLTFYGSASWRLQQWQIALNLFFENPLLGVGWWTYPNYNIWATTPHNDYLRVAAEGGILGLVLYLALIASLIIWFFQKYNNLPVQSDTKKFIGLVFLSIISFVFLGITDNPLGLPEVAWYFWSIIGMGVLAIKFDRLDSLLKIENS